MTTEDALRQRMSPMVQGIWLASESLLMLLDHPDLDIETIRRSPPAKVFRQEVHAFRQWVKDAIEMLPESTFPAEERHFIQHWMEEFDRREANRAIAIVKKL